MFFFLLTLFAANSYTYLLHFSSAVCMMLDRVLLFFAMFGNDESESIYLLVAYSLVNSELEPLLTSL